MLVRLAGTFHAGGVRATSNPGGRGHSWVKTRFVDPWRPPRGHLHALPTLRQPLPESGRLHRDAVRAPAKSGLFRALRREKRPDLRAFNGGASRARTGDLLGAISVALSVRRLSPACRDPKSRSRRAAWQAAADPGDRRYGRHGEGPPPGGWRSGADRRDGPISHGYAAAA